MHLDINGICQSKLEAKSKWKSTDYYLINLPDGRIVATGSPEWFKEL